MPHRKRRRKSVGVVSSTALLKRDARPLTALGLKPGTGERCGGGHVAAGQAHGQRPVEGSLASAAPVRGPVRQRAVMRRVRHGTRCRLWLRSSSAVLVAPGASAFVPHLCSLVVPAGSLDARSLRRKRLVMGFAFAKARWSSGLLLGWSPIDWRLGEGEDGDFSKRQYVLRIARGAEAPVKALFQPPVRPESALLPGREMQLRAASCRSRIMVTQYLIII
jgi:hypothetical protein